MRAAAFALLLGLLPALPLGAQAFDLAGLPAEVAALAPLVEQRCSSCHTLKRVVNAEHKGGQWSGVVESMRRREKSGISAADGTRIASFLAAWSTRDATPPDSTGGAGKPPAAARAGARARAPAIAHSWEIEADAPLPRTMDAAGVKLRLLEIGMVTRPDGSRAASALVESMGMRIELAPGDAADAARRASLPALRSWSIGDYRFRLGLELRASAKDAAPGAKPALALALVVVRDED